MEATDADTKKGITAMVANDASGALLPLLVCVKGKTFQALDTYVGNDYEDWSAAGPHRKGEQRKKFLLNIARKHGCSLNTGTQSLTAYDQKTTRVSCVIQASCMPCNMQCAIATL